MSLSSSLCCCRRSSSSAARSRAAGLDSWGFHWQAFAYALWEQFLAVGMILALLVWFRNRFNSQRRLAKAMCATTYAVYFIHAPVLVYLAIALRDIRLYPLLKFALVAPVGVSLCFLIGYGLRKLPLVRRVL